MPAAETAATFAGVRLAGGIGAATAPCPLQVFGAGTSPLSSRSAVVHASKTGKVCGYHAPPPAAHGDRDMFELLRSSTLRQLLARQAPAFALSLIVAELFYKFGSFTLECLGFLATWFVLDAVFAQIGRALSKPAEGRT